MSRIRLLVCEGNVLERREAIRATTGATVGEAYARTLREIDPSASVDIVCAADEGAVLPAPIDAYDGVAITGSALNIYTGEPAVRRQIDFARQVYAAGVPFFGSCWGLQVATVAAGGEVALNPRGREVAFARKVILTEAGLQHPLHAGRDPAFDAPAIHSDMITRLPDRRPPPRGTRSARCRRPRSASVAGFFGGCNTIRSIDWAISPRRCCATGGAWWTRVFSGIFQRSKPTLAT